MKATMTPVQMIRACSLSLDAGRLVSTKHLVRGAEIFATASADRCPAHADVLRAGACLDNFWSQQYLESLSLRAAWRLWRSWRKATRR